ncbi:hypothetical protein GF356_02375 [candidate division GN15 bacterium]|nr:hypothetical protein [candidate division GN15 bacterium]
MARRKSTTRNDPFWFKDAIFYELRVRSFADSDGDGIGDACEGGGEYQCGDINIDGWINVGDCVYLINFIFRDGSPPCEPGGK